MLPRLTSLRSGRALIAGLLFPALVFRALIPAGFMPAFDARGGLSIVVCPGADSSGAGAVPRAGSEHAGHAPDQHHDHAAHGGAGGGHGSHTGVCPFALSAGPALASAHATAPGTVTIVTDHLHAAHEAPILASIERAQSARGPPYPRWT